MYESHFGLGTRPFALQPDPAFIYWSDQHRLAAEFLARGAASSQGDVLVLSGAVGAGKTTLIMEFLRDPPPETDIVLVRNIPPHVIDALPWIAAAAGLFGARDAQPSDGMLDWVYRTVTAGRKITIIIDEAQNLRSEALTSIVPILGSDASKAPSVLLVLVGQPELPALLRRPENAAISRRVADAIRLDRMRSPDTHAYIRHRLNLGGASEPIFTDQAMEMIHRAADGVPRMVNLIAEQLLIGAYADDRQTIDLATAVDILAESQAPALSAISVAAIYRDLSRGAGETVAAPGPEPTSATSDGSTAPELAVTTEADEGDREVPRRDASPTDHASQSHSAPALQAADISVLPTAPEPRPIGLAEQAAEFTLAPDLAVADKENPRTARLSALRPAERSGGIRIAGPLLLAASLAGVMFLVLRQDPQTAPDIATTSPGVETPIPQTPEAPVPEPDRSADPTPVEPAISEASRMAAASPADLRSALDLADTSPAAAAIVLARTAIAGSDRAAYYLGQLHETGDGVAIDPALAASWYRRAARTLPEAESHLAASESAGFALPLVAPQPQLVARAAADSLDLVWDGSGAAREYRIEIADKGQAVVQSREVAVPAARVALPSGSALWRVTAIGANGDEISGGWQAIPEG